MSSFQHFYHKTVYGQIPSIEQLTESSQLSFEVRIITVGVSEIPINQIFLHDKLVREGLAEGQNGGFAWVGLLWEDYLGIILAPHYLNNRFGTRRGYCGNFVPCLETEVGMFIYIQLVFNPSGH
ncbi:LOW QUALITY PROTEIN: hypothetical protein TorRG33x02_208200 [Trema orientale]|uniref:Uncharacterized protein n=1 Tax=Trema orientale TaxID=63057 RepID=A0A2P5ECZ4_TREOI|nr:LOW QUALITY PROTEIN: hypothetical protein TorRG33x02_208200 [Trema orientale]